MPEDQFSDWRARRHIFHAEMAEQRLFCCPLATREGVFFFTPEEREIYRAMEIGERPVPDTRRAVDWRAQDPARVFQGDRLSTEDHTAFLTRKAAYHRREAERWAAEAAGTPWPERRSAAAEAAPGPCPDLEPSLA